MTQSDLRYRDRVLFFDRYFAAVPLHLRASPPPLLLYCTVYYAHLAKTSSPTQPDRPLPELLCPSSQWQLQVDKRCVLQHLRDSDTASAVANRRSPFTASNVSHLSRSSLHRPCVCRHAAVLVFSVSFRSLALAVRPLVFFSLCSYVGTRGVIFGRSFIALMHCSLIVCTMYSAIFDFGNAAYTFRTGVSVYLLRCGVPSSYRPRSPPADILPVIS